MDLDSHVRACGLEHHLETLHRLARPKVTLRSKRIAQKNLGPTDSRLGGLPHVPPGFEWPRWRDGPLSHLATINLADVAGHDAQKLLPRRGLLRFWYDQDQRAWGFDPKQAGFFRVDYIPSLAKSAKWAPATPPEDLTPFKACSVKFGSGMTVPGWEWMREYAPPGPSIEECEQFMDLEEALKQEAEHHMLGHATPEQSPMETECQLVTHGVYCGGDHRVSKKQIAELRKGERDWRLLLQLDTDEKGPDWMWGDMGKLYFWIPAAALRKAEFEKSWMILQCG